MFRIEVNHVNSGFFCFQAKRNYASISNFAFEAKVRAHPSPQGMTTGKRLRQENERETIRDSI